MKKTIIAASLALLAFAACKPDKTVNPTDPIKDQEAKVINDFVDVVAIPQYNSLAVKADALDASITALNTTPNQTNLDAARTAWKDMRTVWEQCEGFLFGPVENEEYDPFMDTWPTDYVQMDSLLNTSTPLTVQHLQGITLSLRGFHPIEYIIFGDHGNRLPADITARQREYMVSLSADLKTNCHALANAWSTTGGNYGAVVKTAGNTANQTFSSRRALFLAMAQGLIDIADEVGTGKMEEPYVSMDPKTVESPYSGNSVPDFKNNIIGLQNVYLGRYTATGNSLSSLVAINNASLDNAIKAQIAAAIASFDNITVPYEQAIISQRTQIQATQATLATLQATLDGDLKAYITQYIKD